MEGSGNKEEGKKEERGEGGEERFPSS